MRKVGGAMTKVSRYVVRLKPGLAGSRGRAAKSFWLSNLLGSVPTLLEPSANDLL